MVNQSGNTKKMTLTTDLENKDYVEMLFNQNDIQFKVSSIKRTSLYEKKCIQWELPPYTDTVLENFNFIKYETKLENKPKVCNLLGIKNNKNTWIHFKKSKLPKITYNLSEKKFSPKYPIYVISYKRFNKKDCLTPKFLEKMNLPYYICIRRDQKEDYKKFLTEQGWTNWTILLCNSNELGSTIQRNTCWEHSVSSGFKKFWLLDDNMEGWTYFNELKQVNINSPLCFTLLEDLIDNTNGKVGIISHNYTSDVPDGELRNPIQFNCKNYSSLLINTELLDPLNIKFRLLYNEDVDLTLQVLSNGLYTMGTNIFLVNKRPTNSNGGGNTEIYGKKTDQVNKFLQKYLCLENQWKHLNSVIPKTLQQVEQGKSKIPHHKVDYKKVMKIFNLKTELRPKVMGKFLKNYEDFGLILNI